MFARSNKSPNMILEIFFVVVDRIFQKQWSEFEYISRKSNNNSCYLCQFFIKGFHVLLNAVELHVF